MTRTPRQAGARGFTLIEMLVVIIIVAILVTLVVAVGARVTSSARASTTKDVIRALDTVLMEYVSSRSGDAPPAWVQDPEARDELRPIPVIDGRSPSADNVQINSVGLFLEQARDVEAARAAIESLPSDFVRLYTPPQAMTAGGGGGGGGRPTGTDQTHPELLTVFDAWDQPIRYVHPLFDGEVVGSTRPDCQTGSGVRMRTYDQATRGNGYFFESQQFINSLAFVTVRRNYITERERDPEICENYEELIPGDGDGGECVGGRPYFYSAGADGDPSDREDNVYTTEPRFIKPGE